jgi:hypothetical protein
MEWETGPLVRSARHGPMMLRSSTPLILTAFCALTVTSLAAPLRAATPQAPERPVSLLFTQSSTHGSLEPTKCHCRGRHVLTLRGLAAQVVWFEDRPQRHAGQLPAREFAHQWIAFGFRSDPPNAALTLLDGTDAADTVVVELVSRPRYDRERRTMRYVVRLLPKVSGKLADFEADLDAHVPRRFGAASLFIDTAVARQVPSQWLGPGRWRVDL